MRKALDESIRKKLNRTDITCDREWDKLRKELSDRILDSLDGADAFTDKQKEAILSICYETYSLSVSLARLYALEAIRAYNDGKFN